MHVKILIKNIFHFITILFVFFIYDFLEVNNVCAVLQKTLKILQSPAGKSYHKSLYSTTNRLTSPA